jgi:hypothetical protein
MSEKVQVCWIDCLLGGYSLCDVLAFPHAEASARVTIAAYL